MRLLWLELPLQLCSKSVLSAGYQYLAIGVFLIVFPLNLLLSTLAKSAAILRCTEEPGACLLAARCSSKLASGMLNATGSSAAADGCLHMAGPETPTRLPQLRQILGQVSSLWAQLQPRWLELWEVRLPSQCTHAARRLCSRPM